MNGDEFKKRRNYLTLAQVAQDRVSAQIVVRMEGRALKRAWSN